MTTHWGLATVERRSTTEQVLQELRAAIIDGRIGPRAPLREVALAEAFGTGRSAIREALSALGQEGLVVSERNRGTWVRELSPADVIDVYRAREAIETAAVAAALERGAVDLAPLRRALDELRTVSDRDGFESPSQALIAADIDFHRTLVALAQSPRLSRAHEPLAAESQMLLNWHPVYSGSDYVDDHQRSARRVRRLGRRRRRRRASPPAADRGPDRPRARALLQPGCRNRHRPTTQEADR